MGFLSDVKTDQRPAADDNESQARQRARRRLIGAGVLLAVGVIGFPLLFETKPRPVSADVPSVQASRDRPVAAASPSKVVERASTTSATTAASAAPAASASSSGTERAADARLEIAIPAAAAVDAKARADKERLEKERLEKERLEKERLEKERLEKERLEKERLEKDRTEKAKAERERAAHEQAKADEARRAKADEERRARGAHGGRPDGKTASTKPAATASSARFAVQVGAYGSDAGVRDVRSRLERVGLKSYTQVVRSGGASSTRVRVGPYASRQDAEKAVEKARSIGLAPSIVPLTQGNVPPTR